MREKLKCLICQRTKTHKHKIGGITIIFKQELLDHPNER